MSALNPTLPAVSQSAHTLLFRLPYELRHRIYEYILTPCHLHIERRVEYELTNEGIKIIQPTQAGLQARSPSGTATGPETQQFSIPGASPRDSQEDQHKGESGGESNSDNEDTSDDEDIGDEYSESDEFGSAWNCEKLFLDTKSPEFMEISADGQCTRQQAMTRLFRIYYCCSQKPDGPSAVPPGYLDHQGCEYHEEQQDFEGSPLSGFKATCQWAYNEVLTVTAKGARDIDQLSLLPRNRTNLELGSHTLHFSDLKDLACFSGLIPEELSESFHSLSVHIPSMNNKFWAYFCDVYLQPWSRISLSHWLESPEDKIARITFYHNHTTHDLADPTITGLGWSGSPMGRCEIAEALASSWVVPNIQISAPSSSWSTKFRMAALKLRAGSPLDLRLSFPIFLRREEPRGFPEANIPRREWFDSRRWLAENFGDSPIAEEERRDTLRLTWRGDETRDNTASMTSLPEEQWYPQPGQHDTMCEMERDICYRTEAMRELIGLRLWLDAHRDSGDRNEYSSHLAEYDRSFQDTFLRKRRDFPPYDKLLANVNPDMDLLDHCQGLEGLEIDFFGDAHSPGTVKQIQSVGTTLLRDGLVERFTGRAWRPQEGLGDPVSVFWDIGPHPEPNFTGWADPNNNMVGMNLDDAWRN